MFVSKVFVFVGCLGLMVSAAAAYEGVEGNTVRPRQINAKVQGCQIAAPGEYRVGVGDLIELDYTYPVVPTTMPKKVGHSQTLTGAIAKSSLGFRAITTPYLIGSSAIAFYFDAKKEGKDTVTLIIDGKEYEYRFTVESR